MPTAKKIGYEFLVNTYTENEQSAPVMTALADGRFVAVWISSGSLIDGADPTENLHGQIFNADGTKSGAEFLVNTTTASHQGYPAITALANGSFVVTWDDTGTTNVRGRIFNANGAAAGSDFLVNTTTAGWQGEVDVTALVNGRFIVTWVHDTGTHYDVRAQVYHWNGVPFGDEFRVNGLITADQTRPAVTGLLDGRFVTAFRTSFESDGSGGSIRAQIRHQDGSASGVEFEVNTTALNSQQRPSIATLADGRFVVAWDDPSDNTWNIRAQIFNTDGTKSGSEKLVNTAMADHQEISAIAALEDGGFVITWQDSSNTAPDTSNSAIRAQVFNNNGGKVGAEFVVNSTTAGSQHNPDITALGNGRFAVTWEDASQSGGDTSSWAIRGQIFDTTPPARADFDDNGAGDILWQQDNGTIGQWLMNGGPNPVKSTLAGTPDWRIGGIADFNGDGNADMLLRHDTGAVVTWHMDGSNVLSSQYFANAPLDWHIQGTGDFNGDGKGDILWRQDGGLVGTWHMDGGVQLSTQAFANAPPDWHIQGTGDFNGDGKDDILWRHDDGTVGTWHMNGAQTLSTQAFANAPNSWHIEGTGDFNGDGKDDILWRHDDGTVGTWHMNGAQVLSTQTFANAPNAWHIEGAADFNGDGKDDILWRHDNGTVGTWEMNGGTVLATRDYGVVPNDWHIVSNPYDYI